MSGECDKCGEHCLDCKCKKQKKERVKKTLSKKSCTLDAKLAREAWNRLPYDQRLFVTEYIFKAITQEPGCSFRRLIYNRLEFKPESYCDLYHAGGMTITNAMCDQDHLCHDIDAM